MRFANKEHLLIPGIFNVTDEKVIAENLDHKKLIKLDFPADICVELQMWLNKN